MLRLWILPVLGLIAGLGFACSDSGDGPPFSSGTASPTTTTLTNSTYGYSISYPADWITEPADATASDFVTIWNMPPPTSGESPKAELLQFQIIAYPNPDLHVLDAWLVIHDEAAPTQVSVLSKTDTSLIGANGALRLESYLGEGSGAPFYVYYIPTSSSILAITGRPADDSPLADEANSVLATFRLQATHTPSATAASLTYSDPTNTYSFDYPATWRLSPTEDNGGNTILYSYDPDAFVGDGRPVPPDKLKVFFWIADGVNEPLEQWLTEGHNDPGQVSPPTIVSQSETTLGGKSGLNEVTESDGLHTSYYIPLGGGRVFVLNAFPADSQVWPEFEPVLASVRFAP